MIKDLRTLLLCTSIVCLVQAANGADVRLLNGESYEGKVQIANNQIMVVAQTGSTHIDLPQILDAVFRDDAPVVKPGMFPTGVLLTNGTLIAGPIPAIVDPMKIGNASFPLASIAWIVFQPIARDRIVQPSGGRTGVLLPTGDFFPGTIDSITDGRVAINSAIFGPQRFSTKGRPDITALVFRGVQDGAARYEVSVKNGSIYAVSDIKLEGDTLVMVDASFGSVKVSKDDIYEIHLSGSQYQYLASAKPDRVDAPKGVDAATTIEATQNADQSPTQNLQTLVNTAVTYPVPKGFVNFSTGASIPKDAPAAARFTFAIYGDGKFLLAKTSAMGPADNPQHLSAPVANLHTITIRVEPASVDATTGAGLWLQPVFLRQ